MIVLKFPNEIDDTSAKVLREAAMILFNSKREGFRVEWEDMQTMLIYQSETNVAIKKDLSYIKPEEE